MNGSMRSLALLSEQEDIEVREVERRRHLPCRRDFVVEKVEAAVVFQNCFDMSSASFAPCSASTSAKERPRASLIISRFGTHATKVRPEKADAFIRLNSYLRSASLPYQR
jgi:hypothetical protein